MSELDTAAPEYNRPRFGRLLFWLAVIVVCGAFAFSVHLRRPAFARPLSYNYEWLTASVIKFSTSWVQDGPWKLRFAMLEYPRSLDRETIEQRGLYISYPPGQVIPIYLLALLRGQYPGPVSIETWNLFSHFLTVLACFLLVYLMLGGTAPLGRAFFAAAAGVIQIFIAPALWFQQNVYGPDVATIMPFALFVLLLYVVRFIWSRWFVFIGLFLVSLYGCLTDWFFVVTASWVCLFYFYLLLRKKKGAGSVFAAVALGAILAMAFFTWQLCELDGFKKLCSRFEYRMSSQLVTKTTGKSTMQCIWVHFVAFLGRPFCWWALFVSLFPAILMLRAKFRRYLLGLDSQYGFALGFILFPCLLHTALLPYHAAIHDFSVLKYTIPITILTILFFAWMWEALRRLLPEALALVCVAALLCLGATRVLPTWLRIYRGVATFCSDRYARRGLAVRFTLAADEVAVSPDFEIVASPPHALAYSLRSVYRVKDMDEVKIISRRTGCTKIRAYFHDRDDMDLWEAQEGFNLLTKPRPVKEFVEYSSALVNPEVLR